PRVEAGAEGDAQRDGPLDEEVVEVLPEQDPRRLLGGEVDLAVARRHEAEAVGRLPEPPPPAPARGAGAHRGRGGVSRRTGPAGLVGGERVLFGGGDVPDAALGEGRGR